MYLAKQLRLHIEVNESEKYLQEFVKWILAQLESILDKATSLSSLDQCILWSLFHQLRSSTDFQCRWKSFMLSINLSYELIFCQTITTRILDFVLKDKLPISETLSTADGIDVVCLTYEEENAVRYVGGYVVHKLAHLMQSNEEVSVALRDLIDESLDQEAEKSEEWVGTIDRGGLTYITNATFQCLCAIEYALRRYMNIKHAHKFDEQMKDKLMKNIGDDEDVQFHWTIVSVEMDDAVSDTLLSLIINKWITIRGFSFANTILEMYKFQRKQGTQKSKRLRHNIPQK